MNNRIAGQDGATGRTASSGNFVTRLLLVLGGETPMAHGVVGDLEEDYAEVAFASGEAAARRSFARQALGSLPYLIVDGLRHGAPQARARLLMCLAGPLTAASLLAIALAGLPGRPVTLSLPFSATNDIVISTTGPVEIPIRVLDAKGIAIRDAQVRFTRESGIPIEVSPTGTVQCSRPGAASLRATSGKLSALVRVDCQPVKELYTKGWYNLVLNGPPQSLLLGGTGVDGRPVTRLGVDVAVDDSNIATLDRARLIARGPGRTFLSVRAGNRSAYASITVFEPVNSLADLRHDQRYVIASARLRPGQVVRWPLPRGGFSLVNHIDHEGWAPVLGVTGNVMCGPAPGRGVYRTFCHAGKGAWVTLEHPGTVAGSVMGRLALERDSL